MKIIRDLEKNKRGYYGGAVMYLTVDGNFDSCITIRSLQVKDRVAYVRRVQASCMTACQKPNMKRRRHKANSCLRAIRGK